MKETIKLVCIVALTFCCCLMMLEIRALARDVRVSIRLSDSVLANLNDTSRELRVATGAETAKLQATTEEARKTERAFRAGIDSLRQVFIDVHEQVVPGLTKTVTDLDADQNRVTEQALQTIESLKPSLDALAVASAAAASHLSDPAIGETLANIESTSGSAAGIARDARESADMLEARLKQMLKPASTIKTFFLNLLDYGFKFRGLLGF
jgi:hypothetical protein